MSYDASRDWVVAPGYDGPCRRAKSQGVPVERRTAPFSYQDASHSGRNGSGGLSLKQLSALVLAAAALLATDWYKDMKDKPTRVEFRAMETTLQEIKQHTSSSAASQGIVLQRLGNLEGKTEKLEERLVETRAQLRLIQRSLRATEP